MTRPQRALQPYRRLNQGWPIHTYTAFLWAGDSSWSPPPHCSLDSVGSSSATRELRGYYSQQAHQPWLCWITARCLLVWALSAAWQRGAVKFSHSCNCSAFRMCPEQVGAIWTRDSGSRRWSQCWSARLVFKCPAEGDSTGFKRSTFQNESSSIFITSVNSFLRSLWFYSLVSSLLQHSMKFIL